MRWRDVTIDGAGRVRLPRRRPAEVVPGGQVLDAAGLRQGRVEARGQPGAAFLEMWLPRRLPSPNAMLHAHWTFRHAEKHHVWRALLVGTIEATIGWGRLRTLRLVGVTTRRQLWIERLCRDRRGFIRDRENLIYSGKHLVDRIRDLGLIRDDSMAWIDLDVTQRLSDDGLDWTVIRIGPIRPEH